MIYPEPSNYNTCLSITGPSQGLAMGLVSLPNNPISTDEALGYFSISSINAYSQNASQYGVPPDGAGLQLSAVVVLQLATAQHSTTWSRTYSGWRPRVGTTRWPTWSGTRPPRPAH
ncbi:hypothetical protein [Vulcanisaeta sp. JCM 16161]|uniref:hypothetical protein n=1 Tax=Vulcanisaeta sp. JCM 16161 TaxID=1295372 RepID=UPI001FB4D329|nr:hypothetical protein [Vulcanisaeta sp. JCM 16161]